MKPISAGPRQPVARERTVAHALAGFIDCAVFADDHARI
jgi:hypothetical protein